MTDTRTPSPARARVVVIGVAVLLGVGLLAGLSFAAANTERDGAAGDGWHGVLRDAPRDRPDFTLVDTDGRPFDFVAETQGRLTLLFFGYLSCPDVCPVHLATLDAASEQVSADPLVVFVSVDPARDAPAEIRSFLDSFDTDFVGLTGTPEQLEAAQRAAGVPPATNDREADSEDYIVTHSTEIIAYTADDRSHISYPFGTRRADWAADLPALAAGPWSTP